MSSLVPEYYLHALSRALVLLVPLVAALYIHHDYRKFLSLGPGGTPSTPLGYLSIKTLSFVSLRDPLRPLPIPPHFRPQKGYLDSLPLRAGPRPLVQGIAPQRQQTQKSDGATYAQLMGKIRELARDPRNKLLERTSCFEKHSSGLFASVPITRTCGGEICHAHPSDGSLHLTLHPADGRTLISRGWGQRHPLARGGWFRRFVPREFMLVYAPRTEDELEVVMLIVAASVWWVSGVDVREERLGDKTRYPDDAAIGAAFQGQECWACKMRECGKSGVEQMAGSA